MMGFYNINAAGPGEGQAGQPLFQTFGRAGFFSHRYDGYLSGNYHALQLALNRPLTKGIFVKGAYTWSKAMNRQDDDGWATIDWNHPSVLSKNYGPAGFDRTHVFQLGFVADLPFGKEGGGVVNAIIKDWSLNGIFSYVTGTPFTVESSGASVNAPGNLQTADLVGTPDKLGGIGAEQPLLRSERVGPRDRGPFRQHRAATRCGARGPRTSTSRSSAGSRSSGSRWRRASRPST